MARLNDSIVVYERTNLPDPKAVWETVVKPRTSDEVKEKINLDYNNLVKDFTIREFVIRWITVKEDRVKIESETETYTLEKGVVENYPILSDVDEIKEKRIDPPFIYDYTELECDECSSSGTKCHNCNSKGYVDCTTSTCNRGTIEVECNNCYGSGNVSVDCKVCDGTGYSIEAQCRNCGGTGCDICGGGIFREACSNCRQGTVSEFCDECNGSGRVTSGECDSCSQYSNIPGGKVPCPDCNNGEDESICEECLGYGKFHEVTLVTDMEQVYEEHKMPVTGEDQMRTGADEYSFDPQFVDTRRAHWYFESDFTPEDCDANVSGDLQPVDAEYSPEYEIEYHETGYGNPHKIHWEFESYFGYRNPHRSRGFLERNTKEPSEIETIVKKSEKFYEYTFNYVEGLTGKTPVCLTQDHKYVPDVKATSPDYIVNDSPHNPDMESDKDRHGIFSIGSSSDKNYNISSRNVIEDIELDPTPSDRGVTIDPSVTSVKSIGSDDSGGFFSSLL